MGGEKRTYGTYVEGGTGKGECLWNVNKEYRKNLNIKKINDHLILKWNTNLNSTFSKRKFKWL